MPPKSQAQRRWAFAAAEGKIKGTPKSVGVEFEGPGIKGLPKRATPTLPKARKVATNKPAPPMKLPALPGDEPLPIEHSSLHH